MTFAQSTPIISKEPAPSDIERMTARWETWHCDSREFQHCYVPGATFYVVRGRAHLTFSHGAALSIEAGDLVSIGEGAQAQWAISAPVETRYTYHDHGDASSEN
ncbi:hypothetical protein AWB70_01811 [Caballeronia cordobensis]|uniref:(S)-ureidoglycine aminohydrolase cupin domain-containing protein n=2 Tax=Caballeronia cordobensis TaxID=1353886 RepID=A0A158GD00_CABCO|nr:hypothetical protein AWB70_01811 [Caballeronia cordobensis]